MIDTQYITQLQKQYPAYLQGVVMSQPFEPVILRGGKDKPGTTRELHQQIQLFQKNEKTSDRKGWQIEWEEWPSKKLGRQQWPKAAKDLIEALQLQRKPVFYAMRWLDQTLADTYTHGMLVQAVTPQGLRKVLWKTEAICLVENETNLYLLPETKGMLAIDGRGKALALLKEIPLLQQARLFYWGDLDEEGFHMLNRFREQYPHVQSLMMDEATVLFHLSEMRIQPVAYRPSDLRFLLPAEQAAYKLLSAANGRIEQEKLQQEYMQEVVLRMLQG